MAHPGMVEWIKQYRANFGAGLRESKDAWDFLKSLDIDPWTVTKRVESPPPRRLPDPQTAVTLENIRRVVFEALDEWMKEQ